MGFEIIDSTMESKFLIKRENLLLAFSTLKQEILSKKELSGWIIIVEVEKSRNLMELMSALRWSPQLDDSGNIVSVKHNGYKVAEEELLFKTIALFVEDGSFVEYEREGYSTDLKVRFNFVNTLVTITVWNKIYNDIKYEDEFVLNKEYGRIL